MPISGVISRSANPTFTGGGEALSAANSVAPPQSTITKQSIKQRKNLPRNVMDGLLCGRWIAAFSSMCAAAANWKRVPRRIKTAGFEHLSNPAVGIFARLRSLTLPARFLVGAKHLPPSASRLIHLVADARAAVALLVLRLLGDQGI